MINARTTAGLLLALFASVLVPQRAVDAQIGVSIDPEIVAMATSVVRGSVVATHDLQTDSKAYSVAEIAVSDEIKGDTTATIFVATEGGTLADGTIVKVSHTPTLSVGQELQIALVSAESPLATSIEVGLGANIGAVYEIAGGEDGVVSAVGGAAEFAGVQDYALSSARWSSFDPPGEFKINPTGSGLPAPDTIGAIRRAAQKWVDDPGSRIALSYEGWTTASGADYRDGVNVISFAYLPSKGFLAQATWASRPDGQFSFDIVVNTKYTFGDRSGAGSWFDLETVLLHEFGHVLGLSHTSAASEVMHGVISPRSAKGLGSGDRAGVGFLYPARTCNGKEVTVDMGSGNGAPTSGDDVILGTEGVDTIDGLGGNDTICGLGGNDTINGGNGNDQIFGGNGNDIINGGSGADLINGQTGNDDIAGGDSADVIYGSSGEDDIDGGDGWDTIQGNGGDDTINGGNGNDNINAGEGNDTVDGGSGHDLINGGNENDTLTGGNENDRINGQNGDDIVKGGRGQDQIWGAYGNDTLHGQDDIDWIWGGWGADVINGGSGDDRMYGEGHDDSLNGNAGKDLLDGGVSFDTCDGGPGSDTSSACEIDTNTP